MVASTGAGTEAARIQVARVPDCRYMLSPQLCPSYASHPQPPSQVIQRLLQWWDVQHQLLPLKNIECLSYASHPQLLPEVIQRLLQWWDVQRGLYPHQLLAQPGCCSSCGGLQCRPRPLGHLRQAWGRRQEVYKSEGSCRW